MRLLVVDDEPDILASLELLAMDTDIDVIPASSAEQALAMDVTPDVALTDFKMPRMDGIAFTKEFLRRNPSTPVFLMTVFPDVELRSRAMAAGCHDVIDKPYDPDDLFDRIRAAI